MEVKINLNKDRKIHLICGMDRFLVKEKINEIEEDVLKKGLDEFNIKKMDGEKFDFEEFYIFCETHSIIPGEKLAIIKNADFLLDSKDSLNKEIFEKFKNYTDNIPENVNIIAYYIFSDKREKPSKRITSFQNKANVVCIEKLNSFKLDKQIKDMFDKKNLDAGIFEIKYFASKFSSDFSQIENEIEKLYNYSNGEKITKNMIDKVVRVQKDDDIFTLISYISEKKNENAVKILNELLNEGEEAIGILYMISRQFLLLHSMYILLEAKWNFDDIVKELKLNKFIAEKMRKQLRGFTLKNLENAIIYCCECEKNIKTSSISKELNMEMLITNIAKK